MNKIAIIGYGTLGKQIDYFLRSSQTEEPETFLLFDDNYKKDSTYSNIYCLADCFAEDFKHHVFYIGIGYKHLNLRRKIIERLVKLGRQVPPLVHNSCLVSGNATIQNGCILFPGCIIDQHVILGAGNILHNSVVVSHDTIIGACNYFSPSVTICGNVRIGAVSFLGAGTIVSNSVAIGDNVKAGIATSIAMDVPANTSVIGNPLRLLDTGLKLI